MVWILIALIPAVYLLGRIARLRANDMKKSRPMKVDFFKIAGDLVDDDDTPETVVDCLEIMVENIGRTILSWRVIWHAMNGRLKNAVRNPNPRWRKMTEEIDACRPELRASIMHAFVLYLLVVTYNSLVAGRLVRTVFLFMVWRSGRRQYSGDETSVVVVSDVFSNGNGDCPAAA